MGACTVTPTQKGLVFGNKAVSMGTIAVSSSYATGGDTFTAASFGLNNVDVLTIFPGYKAGTPNLALMPVADLTNLKMKLFGMGAAATTGTPLEEFPNGTDGSGYVCTYIAYGAP